MSEIKTRRILHVPGRIFPPQSYTIGQLADFLIKNAGQDDRGTHSYHTPDGSFDHALFQSDLAILQGMDYANELNGTRENLNQQCNTHKGAAQRSIDLGMRLFVGGVMIGLVACFSGLASHEMVSGIITAGIAFALGTISRSQLRKNFHWHMAQLQEPDKRLKVLDRAIRERTERIIIAEDYVMFGPKLRPRDGDPAEYVLLSQVNPRNGAPEEYILLSPEQYIRESKNALRQ